MSVLVDQESRVLIQGMTGREGAFHTRQMRDFGTNIVAGVSPGKGGSDADGVPVFDTVADAVEATGPNVAGVFVPPAFAADAIMESAASKVPLTVCITEGIPVQDMVRARRFVDEQSVRLLGPNCPGIVTPGQCKVGIIPNHINASGAVGIVGRSGTLTYEVIQGLTLAGLGETTSVGVGGDPVLGLSFSDVLELFAGDSETRAVVLIGEIGGSDEEAAAAWIRQSGFDRPVIAFISGRTAPPGKRMGHAGAIISGNTGTAQSKIDALSEAGAAIADTIEDVVRLTAERVSPRVA
ncbi:MAG: succinate--CoA ligase subunit alpha [Candidatus Dormibacteraeota bacterium]|nr:succinate--CoA ligase subunit alpha [Candidatus Dormibacteraeota bacterium]